MNRAIKFRGRVINRKAAVGYEADIGDIVTGSLIVYEEELFRRRYWINRQEKGAFHIAYPVDPESVAQLVGFDCDGNEVYEGDVLVGELEQEYTTEIYDHPEKIRSLKLKE